MTLYARKVALRNCGRFTVVQSDFGADYRTHTHVTSEALYASLTRGITWLPQIITVKRDSYEFARDYDVQTTPIWFTPGVFLNPTGETLVPQSALDTTYFNVMHEVYPTTSKSYGFDGKSGELVQQSRPHHTPTYGTWQSIKPNNRFTTLAYSPNIELLNDFTVGQTFLLGKKRTMVQIIEVGETMAGEIASGSCLTPFLQVPTTGIAYFQSFEVLAGTVRYLVMRGQTRTGMTYIQFGENLALPEFVIPSYMIG